MKRNSVFNLGNVFILLNALKKEPFWLIVRNVLRRFSGKKGKDDYQVQANGFILSIEILRFYSNRIEIIGWVLCKNSIEVIEIFSGQQKLGEASYKEFRPDIDFNLLKFYKESKNCGFSFLKDISNRPESIIIKATDSEGKEVNLRFEEIAVSIQEQYYLSEQNRSLKQNKLKKRFLLVQKKKTSNITFAILIKNNDTLDKLIKKLDIQNNINHKFLFFDFIQLDWERYHITDNCKIIQCKKEIFNDSFFFNQVREVFNEDYLLVLDGNIELEENWLELLGNIPLNTDVFYFDHLLLNNRGEKSPVFKPDYSPDLLLSYNYIGGCYGISKKSFSKCEEWIKSFDSRFSLYKWILFTSFQSDNIFHSPNVFGIVYEQYENTFLKENLALTQFLKFANINAKVEKGLVENTFRVKRTIIDCELVSIIIPFKDRVDLLKMCISSIFENTDYLNYEIILMDNNSVLPETEEYLKELNLFDKIRIHNANYPFNYSKINNEAAALAKGKFLLFLNNDTQPLQKGWLSALVEQGQREEVGAVGAKLLYADKTIQHAGVVYGISGGAVHVHKNYHANQNGYMNRINSIQNFSICTAACLLTRKTVFKEIGGFDEEHLGVSFNDVDLCLTLRSKNYLVVYTPFSTLFHYESISRGKDDNKEKLKKSDAEIRFLRKKWKKEFKKGDPYYNPNLSHRHKDFGIDY